MKGSVCLTFCSLLLSFHLSSQADFGFEPEIAVSCKHSEKLSYSGGIKSRYIPGIPESMEEIRRVDFILGGEYTGWKGVDLGVNYMFRIETPADDTDSYENRFSIYGLVKSNIGKAEIGHRLRAELRAQTLITAWRMRYRFSSGIPILRNKEDRELLAIKSSAEAVVQFQKELFDEELRLILGLAWSLTELYRIEVVGEYRNGNILEEFESEQLLLLGTGLFLSF